MKTSTLLKTGITGVIVSSLCCFTPLLVILLGSIGLSAWLGHLDTVLFPLLVFFLILTVYAFIRRDKGLE